MVKIASAQATLNMQLAHICDNSKIIQRQDREQQYR
jgi:hypothetical protein